MHGNTHIALMGIVAHITVQLSTHTTRSTRTEPDMDAIISSPIPLTMHIEYTKEASLTALNHARMHGIILCRVCTDIHNNTSQTGTNTTLFYSTSNAIKTVTMSQHRFKEGCGARFKHLSHTET